jgi:hypothetical protein
MGSGDRPLTVLGFQIELRFYKPLWYRPFH